MTLRPLGSTGLLVSPIGFGCWQLGGQGWGTTSAKEILEAVRRALGSGIRLFDTAPVYGFGRSEELLGKALKASSHGAVVVSKGGLVWDSRKRVSHDNRPASLREQLHGTLRRLGRDSIDVYLLHWPDAQVPLGESAVALEALRKEGKLVAWGLSNFPASEVQALDARGIVLEYPLNCVGLYEANHRAPAAAGLELLELVTRNDHGFIAYDALAKGLLACRRSHADFGKRDLRSRDGRFLPGGPGSGPEKARGLAALASAIGAPPAALALRAVLERRGVTSVLAGMRSVAQLEENLRAVELPLSDSTLRSVAAL